MRKLEEKNLIEGYHAVLNAKKFNLDITGFIFVEVDGSANYPAFVERVVLEPEVLECHSITGDGSHVLKIRTQKYRSPWKNCSPACNPGTGFKKNNESNIVLTTYKETRQIDVRTSA